MAVTVTANGLTITHKGSGGMHMCSAPDVCKTPTPGGPVPIPYPIFAMNTDIAQGTTTVQADGGQMIAHRTSVFMKCTGDQPGTIGGVVSGVFGQKSEWITFSPTVYVQGKNISRLTDKLFMNNKNTIAGQGGQVEMPIPGGDVVLDALCDIFCEARDEWQKCKKGPGPCKRPSTLAKEKAEKAMKNGKSPLSKAMKKRFPKAFGAAEKSFFTSGDNLLGSSRKFYTKQGLKNALERQVQKVIKKAGIDAAKRMGKKFWMKAIPGLNVLSTIYDVYELGGAAVDIYKAIKGADTILDNAVRVQPDFSVVGEDGALKDIYDFKFDDKGYQDTFSPEQKQLYKDMTGKDPIAVDDKTCNCKARMAKATS